MIINKNTIYAKVWNTELSKNGKYLDLQISTSEKNEDGTYTNSGWFPRAIGHAVNSLKNVKEGDKIEILGSKFTNERKELDDGTKKSFFKFIIFDAKIQSSENNEKPAHAEPTISKHAAKSKANPVNNNEDPF